MSIHRKIHASRSSLVLFGFSLFLFLGTVSSFYYLLHKNNLLPGNVSATYGYISWRVFDGGIDDPGSNYNESALNTSNVSGLKVLWESSLPATADDSVVEEAAVNTSSGPQNLVFVNTIKGNLIAYNALTGAKVWEADPSSADFNGQGTKSSPAIDPSGNYIYAYAVDGYAHKYNIATGAEVTGNGFPAQITLLPNDTEKGSSSLNIANGYLYMTMSGNDGDYGHYVGHVVAVNLSNGAESVWNAECSNITQLLYTSGGNYCSNTMSGIWARPGVKVDPVTGNVFFATGNGNYNANSGGNNWGDSIIELTPNLSSMVDSYTPTTYSSLDSSDADLGSTAPVILPTQSGSNTPYMLVQGGKDSILRLLNRSNLSGQSGPRHTGGELQTITLSNSLHEEPAVWVDGSGTTWVFVTDDSNDLYAYKVVTSGGVSSLSQVYEKNYGAYSSPFVADGVLYLDGSNVLALNATTGSQLFSSSSISVSLNQHWEAPTVVNGEILTSDNNGHLYALYVPGVTPTSPPTGSGGSGSGSTGGSGSSSSGGSSNITKSSGSGTSAQKSTNPSSTTQAGTKTASGSGTTNSSPNSQTQKNTQVGASASPSKSPSFVTRASSPLFIASASTATIVTAGVVVKLLVLKGVISANVIPNVPPSITSKLRLLARLITRR
jgi:hypothetical protein